MNAEQIGGLLRNAGIIASALVALLGALGADPMLVEKISATAGALGENATAIGSALAMLASVVGVVYSTWIKSTSQQIKTVEAMPGVGLVVDPIAAPQAAIDAANDPLRIGVNLATGGQPQ